MKPLTNKIQGYYTNKGFGPVATYISLDGLGVGVGEIYWNLNGNQRESMYNKTRKLREIFWQTNKTNYEANKK